MTNVNIYRKFSGLFLAGVCFWGLQLLVVNCGRNTDQDTRPEPQSLFNGVDLTGWKGDTTIWKAENQQIVGSTMDKMIDHAVWLTTEKEFDNFELSLWVKLIGDDNKNSGVYYRGQWQDIHVVGYEFDIGGWGAEEGETDENWWGELHDPYRREDMWIGPGREVIDKTYKESEWNFVKIRADGNHIQHWLNGQKMVDWHEQDPEIPKSGFIAFQLHDESRFKVYYKDIKLVPLSD
jgi:hypothetical protein